MTAVVTVNDNGDGTMSSDVSYDGGEIDSTNSEKAFVNVSDLTDRMPVTGSHDIIIIALFIALVLGGILIVWTNGRRSK